MAAGFAEHDGQRIDDLQPTAGMAEASRRLEAARELDAGSELATCPSRMGALDRSEREPRRRGARTNASGSGSGSATGDTDNRGYAADAEPCI